MSVQPLPKIIDPIRFSDVAAQFTGELTFENMARLKEFIFNKAQDLIKVKLDFGIDEQGLRYLHVELETNLILKCQRCLELYGYEVATNYLLSPVKTDDEAKLLPEIYDPLMIADEIYLCDIIEDELLLNLPFVMAHSDNQFCANKLSEISSAKREKISNNPFSELAKLKLK